MKDKPLIERMVDAVAPAPAAPPIPAYRLALRPSSGGLLVAWFASTDTMKGAKPLLTIESRLVELDPQIGVAFEQLATLAYTRLVEQMTGRQVTSINVKDAPAEEGRIVIAGAGHA
jgi:hypothetical protein